MKPEELLDALHVALGDEDDELAVRKQAAH